MEILNSDAIVERLKQARVYTILTGAGISAESGIPTFRGENGLWKNLSPHELASIEAFYRNTAIVNEWYRHRRDIIEKCTPNAGHYALTEMSKYLPTFYLITQNVDGLHQRAGVSDVIELHGNIMQNYCIRCGTRYNVQQFDEIYEHASRHIPRCDCGGVIRPDVVWFGEALPAEALERAFQAAENAEVFLSIGTSAQVRPASDLPLIAKKHGAFFIEININATMLSSSADLLLQGPSGEILPKLNRDLHRIISAN